MLQGTDDLGGETPGSSDRNIIEPMPRSRQNMARLSNSDEIGQERSHRSSVALFGVSSPRTHLRSKGRGLRTREAGRSCQPFRCGDHAS